MSKHTDVLNAIVIDADDELIEEIKKDSNIKRVSPNLAVYPTLMDSVPLINADDVWQLDNIGNQCASSGKECLTGKGVTIGIIDTGVDYTHPDLGGCTKEQFLSGNCAKVVGGWDFVTCEGYNDDETCSVTKSEDADPMDENGHGTHVASIAAGKESVSITQPYGSTTISSINGVAPDATIYAYRVVGRDGRFINEQQTISWLDVVISAIERSTDPNQDENFADHLDVISLSIGTSCLKGVLTPYDTTCGPDDAVSTAIDNAVSLGVVAVVAAGNNGDVPMTIITPGTARKAITVGAVYKKDYGTFTWNCEPGEKTSCGWCGDDGTILCDNHGYGNVVRDQIVRFSSKGPVPWVNSDGVTESINTPDIVAPGATALLLQKHPEWKPEQVKAALMGSAKDLGYDINTQGAGRLDVLKAIDFEESTSIKNSNGEVVAVFDSYGNIRLKGKCMGMVDCLVGFPLTNGNLMEFSIKSQRTTLAYVDSKGNFCPYYACPSSAASSCSPSSDSYTIKDGSGKIVFSLDFGTGLADLCYTGKLIENADL